MTYDPTLTPKEQDEQKDAPQGGATYRIEYRENKTLMGRIKTIINSINTDADSIKTFYYAMKSSLLYVAQGLVGLVTLTLWQPNWTTRAITLRAKHSQMARATRNKKEQAKYEASMALVDAIKAETTEKVPELSADEKMEEWIRKFKE